MEGFQQAAERDSIRLAAQWGIRYMPETGDSPNLVEKGDTQKMKGNGEVSRTLRLGKSA